MENSVSDNKEIALVPGTRVMTSSGWKNIGEISRTDKPSIVDNLLAINEETYNKLSTLKNLTAQNAIEQHDCWRCLPDDEQPITLAWLEWAGFRKVRWQFCLDRFSFGPQIDFKWNAFWMQTTHNMAPVTKRWEVRSLLAVHRDKLVEVGHGKIWEVAPEFEEY